MNNKIFSQNLRRLRIDKNLTQEQLANMLGVSSQSVSRWECGNTLPDVMLLPEIAKLYGVTVDDLYKEEAEAYPNYAQRLLAVYEASGRSEDFLMAEQEFERIPSDELTADDLRSWGVLYHYMMQHSARKARQKLDEAMNSKECPEHVFRRAAQQKIALQCDLGKGSEEAAGYDKKLEENAANPQIWLLCTAAHYMTREYEQAMKVVLKGMEKFPDMAALTYYAGDICRELKRYEEAFFYWEKTLKLNNTFLDAMYSMGFCHEELGQYREAYEVWTELEKELKRQGFVIESKWPAEMAERCKRCR